MLINFARLFSESRCNESKKTTLNFLFKSFFYLQILLFLFFLIQSSVYATTYYVANAGNDSCDGTSQTIGSSSACAWKTIAKVNASSFLAGDSISFNKSDTWREQLNIPSSGSSGNPITFNSYGSGNKPKIYGSTVPSSWTSESYAPTYTISKVQGPPVIGSGTTSVTSTFASTPTQNNLEIAWLGCTGSTAGISSAAISGFSLANSGIEGTGNGFISIWYKVAGAGESTGVTATITGGVGCNLIVEEWTNLATSTPLDKTAKTDDTGGTVSSRSSGTTPTTTVASELVVAGVMTGSTTTSKSWSNSFTSEYSNDSFNIVTSSKIVSSTATYESTLSWTTARRAGGTIATFKGFSGATTQLYYTSQSADPGYMWFIDTGGTVHKGNKVASKDLLLSDYDWWFDSVNSRLYINSATDPLTRYSSVEVVDTTKNTGIFWTGSGESYITVDGFEVAFVAGPGIVTRGDYWIITNNTIHHLGDRTPTGHSYGIELQTANYTRVANNIVHDTLRSCVYIVTSYTPFINTNNTIESNTLYDCADAVLLANTENTHGTNVFNSSIIRYNNMYHSSSFSLGTGQGMGIQLVGSSGGFPVDSYQIYYNTISVKKKAISLGDYVTNTTVYNNSILANGSGAGSGMGIYVSGTGNSGITIKNNLVADAGLYGLDIVDKTAISALDYNIWYAPTGTGYANINATNYTSSGFATYKSDTGWDTHGYWQNPLIVSASTPDFHLQPTSTSINTGTNVSLTTDYVGTTVPQGSAPDIGAYEYIPLTVTINQAVGQSDPTNFSTINFTVVFSEPVADFVTGDVTLAGTAGATTATVTGSGNTYNVAVTGMSGSGTVIASILADKATGATGNTNNASTSTDNTVNYDNMPPAFSSKTTFSGWYSSNQTSTFTYIDSDSGIVSGTPVTCTISSEGTGQTCSVTPNVCDTAGNCNTTPVTSNGADIDKSNPSTPGTPSTTTPTSSSSQTWSWSIATDTVSGVFNYLWRTTGTAITNGTSATNSVVTSLTEGIYNFFVRAVDNAGNQGNESSAGALTVDQTTSSITIVSSGTPISSGTTITWTTNENSSSKVDYGLTTSYSSTTPETDTPTRVSSHSVSLTDLVSCTTYHYRVKSKDSALNEAIGSDNNFTTAGCTGSATIDSQSSSQITTGVGGTLSLLDGDSHGIGLSIPASYSGTDANFQAHQLDTNTVLGVTSNPSGYLVVGDYIYELKALTDNSSTITTFDNPITITMSYGSADIVGIDESTLKIYRWNGSVWNQGVGCVVNTTLKTVTCTTTHFSTFGLFGQATATPTPTPIQGQNNNTNSSSTSNNSAPSCNDSAPSTPKLFQADVKGNSTKLFFTPLADTNKFYVSYSTKTNAEEHGVEVTLAKEGVQNYTVNALKPNTIYYFKIRGQNGCMPGNWSEIIKVKTGSVKTSRYISYYMNSRVSKITSVFSAIKWPKTKTTVSTKLPIQIVTPAPQQVVPVVTNKQEVVKTPAKKQTCILWWCW